MRSVSRPSWAASLYSVAIRPMAWAIAPAVGTAQHSGGPGALDPAWMARLRHWLSAGNVATASARPATLLTVVPAVWLALHSYRPTAGLTGWSAGHNARDASGACLMRESRRCGFTCAPFPLPLAIQPSPCERRRGNVGQWRGAEGLAGPGSSARGWYVFSGAPPQRFNAPVHICDGVTLWNELMNPVHVDTWILLSTHQRLKFQHGGIRCPKEIRRK